MAHLAYAPPLALFSVTEPFSALRVHLGILMPTDVSESGPLTRLRGRARIRTKPSTVNSFLSAVRGYFNERSTFHDGTMALTTRFRLT